MTPGKTAYNEHRALFSSDLRKFEQLSKDDQSYWAMIEAAVIREYEKGKNG